VLSYTKAYSYNATTEVYDEYTTPTPVPVISSAHEFITIYLEGDFSSIQMVLYKNKGVYGPEKHVDINDRISTIEGYENLSFVHLKETSGNVVSFIKGTSDDSKGNKGDFQVIHNDYMGYWIHREPGEGMYASMDFGPIENRNSVFYYTELDDMRIDWNYRFNVKGNNVYGTWNASWEGGSNKGTFSFDIPLRKTKQ
jgi:hypothetical protein